MTDWIEHNGGPQPVADDVWVEAYVTKPPLGDVSVPNDGPASVIDWSEVVEYRILNQHLIDAKQAEIYALREMLRQAVDANSKFTSLLRLGEDDD